MQILGYISYPSDDGAAAAAALGSSRADLFADGTVLNECRVHAYTLRALSDDYKKSISGAAPTCRDPLTISSLQIEHYGFYLVMNSCSQVSTPVWIPESSC